MGHGPVIMLSLDIVDITSHTSHVRVFVSLHIGMMLKENNSLKELRLWRCVIEQEGLEDVIKGVQVNTTLETLNLSRTKIDNKIASSIGKIDIIQWGELCTCTCKSISKNRIIPYWWPQWIFNELNIINAIKTNQQIIASFYCDTMISVRTLALGLGLRVWELFK